MCDYQGPRLGDSPRTKMIANLVQADPKDPNEAGLFN